MPDEHPLSRRYELLRLLEEHSPTPPEERAHAEMLDLISGPGDPFSKYRYEPGHFTVGSFVLSADRSSVALVHHKRLDRWLEPGGHIDPGDVSVMAAALRELREETALDQVDRLGSGLLDIDVHPIPAAKGEPHHDHLNLNFGFLATGEHALVHDPSESNDARWQRIDTVTDVTDDPALLRCVAKLVASV